MNEQRKHKPEPLDGSEVLKAALTRASRGEFDEDLAISLRIAGGAPEQRYSFAFATSGGRLEVCRLDCEMSDRHGADHGHEVDAKTISSLGRSLVRSELLSITTEPPRFLPDTLVGIIEITSGSTTHRIYFAADADQAAVQDVTPPDAVLKAADAIYQAAGTILNIENVRP
jgi:hypothetical protein